MKVSVPISLGELLDKISILEIKNKKILNESKILNIKKELNGLNKVLDELNINLSESNSLYNKLYKINLTLWEIEDSIRVLEKNEDFGDKFIELARAVYKTNDQRFEIKNDINKLFNSEYVEEKSYEDY
tara:strand:- start:1471 stop:1857 length:387 start_codon:yes stop_codon:yes gene_type:complete